jgi:hypothetical protein
MRYRCRRLSPQRHSTGTALGGTRYRRPTPFQNETAMAKDPILDTIILQYSQYDCSTFRDLAAGGCLTLGGLGSGKTANVFFLAVRSVLSGPYGAAFFSVKSDEPARVKKVIRELKRQADLIEFGYKSNLTFDPLAYMVATSQGSVLTESIAELFNNLIAVGKVYQPSSGERYFEDAVAELVRAAVVILSAAGEPISIATIHNLICSIPESLEQVDSEEWQKGSYCGRIINQVRERKDNFSEQRWNDLDVATVHLLQRFPTLDPRTRSNVESTLTGLCSKFLYEPFRSMFCSGRFDFTPSQLTHEHKLLLISMPLLEVGRDTGRLCQVLMKLVLSRAWCRHQYEPGCCNGAFMFIDEASFLMSKMDVYTHMVNRSSAFVPFLLLQNILTIAGDEFGENTPGSKTLGFLGLIGTKIFLANNETYTNNYAADLIGKEYRYIDSWNAGSSENHHHAGIGGAKQLSHLVEPIEFTKLLRPDGEQPLAEAIVHSSGRIFESTKTSTNPRGLPYLRVHFSR